MLVHTNNGLFVNVNVVYRLDSVECLISNIGGEYADNVVDHLSRLTLLRGDKG